MKILCHMQFPTREHPPPEKVLNNQVEIMIQPFDVSQPLSSSALVLTQ